ncbi:MAG TPA: nuclear transport factor 2 family protein [Methyloceanibacter sp.]|jgi:ketosteroid isomerase-like protein
MRRFRFNGWQRIFIVLSVVWTIVGGSWGWQHANDKADAEFKLCITQIQTASDVQACRAKRAEALVPNWFGAAVVALAPITIAGLFFYGLIFVARRIGRAFSPEPNLVGAAELPPKALQPAPVSRAAEDIGKSPNKRTVEKYMDAFRRSDHQQVLSCLTDDVEWVIPGLFHVTGKDAFDREIENPAFVGSPVITVTRLTEESDVVVAEGNVHAARRDGGFLNAVFCDVFEMQDAKIRRLVSYLMEVKGS